jgi:hypothetical protein
MVSRVRDGCGSKKGVTIPDGMLHVKVAATGTGFEVTRCPREEAL